MRRFIHVAAAVAAMACAGNLIGSRAEAMAMPGGSRLGAPTAAAEQVYLRCTRFWNGWRWVRQCVDVGGPVYYSGPGYPAPGYGYYGGWRPRRYYGYY